MWNQKDYDKEKETVFKEKGYNKLLSRLLSQRKIDADDIESFLRADYKNIPHPFELHDLEKAVDILIEASEKGWKAKILGDYDVDGIVSSHLIAELFDILKIKYNVFLPSRTEHGYGLNEKTMAAVKSSIKNNVPEVILLTDCGSNNNDEIAELKSLGVKKVIVLDHHLIDDEKRSRSADALISWHLSDSEEMCSCGEAFQLIRGVRAKWGNINPIEFMTLAALGTIGDVSEVKGVKKGINRILIRNAFKKQAIDSCISVGLHEMFKKNKLNGVISQDDIAFKIVPKLNAAGRIAEPDIAFKLMIERNNDKASAVADLLLKYNDQRKEMQRLAEEVAIEEVRSNPDEYKHGILIFNEEFHTGILGIIASKLSETFRVPSIVLGKNGELIKGSGRTYGDIDLMGILDDCSELFDNYGGHKQAAGVTLNKNCLDIANNVFNDACKDYYEHHELSLGQRYYDAELKITTMSNAMKIGDFLYNQLYPYGQEFNPEPIFKVSDVKIVGANTYEGAGWRLTTFEITKDGVRCPFPFKTFSKDLDESIGGLQADIYFKFPQSDRPDNYGKYTMNVEDIEIKS